jgi:PleD family two-component response regulator
MSEPARAVVRPSLILLVNDQEWAAAALENVLAQSGYATMRARTGQQALALCASANPDAVIMDTRLSDISGVEVCRQLRHRRGDGGLVPVILTTTSAVSRAESLAALEAGAWELCGQPLDGDTLLLKLCNFVRAKRVSDAVRSEGLLDAHSGLYNVRGLARRANEIGAEAQRLHTALACVAFDIEDQRWPAGAGGDDGVGPAELSDLEVGRLGDVCRRFGRASDAYGRLGPREFAVVAPATGAEGAQRLVERMQEAMDALEEERPHALSLRLRAEYCVVDDYAESPVDAVEMLMRASAALRPDVRATAALGAALGSARVRGPGVSAMA